MEKYFEQKYALEGERRGTERERRSKRNGEKKWREGGRETVRIL